MMPMVELVSLWLFALVFALTIYVKKFKSNDRLPPGPPWWSILANLLFNNINNSHITLNEWAKKYGSIYRIYLGGQLTIVLNSVEAAKEAFVNQAEIFAGRPQQFVFDKIWGQRVGIVNVDGPVWKQQRWFTLQALRNFGVGHALMETKIRSEIEILLKEIDRRTTENNGVIDILRPMKFAVGNIISSILLGQTFDHGDPEFSKLQVVIEENFCLLPKLQIFNSFPFLRYMIPDGLGFWQLMRNISFVEKFVRSHIAAHQAEILKHKPKEINDFCHAYLAEMKRMKRANDPDQHMFNLNQLRGIIGDMFVAGQETTANTLAWAILYMIHYPEIQQRCYEELSKFGRIPDYKDWNGLNYIQAVLLEIQRCSKTAPISLLHSTLDNTELFKYKIPKDSIVILNLSALMQNPEYFAEPEKFNPDRFLNENGGLKTNEAMIPFSIGKRSCAGESLAKMKLFMIFSALIFTYKISSKDEELPSLEPVFGFTLSPKPYAVKLENRL